MVQGRSRIVSEPVLAMIYEYLVVGPNWRKNFRALTVPSNLNADDDGNGYTNLEEWLQSYAETVEGSGGFTDSGETDSGETDSGETRPKPPKLN